MYVSLETDGDDDDDDDDVYEYVQRSDAFALYLRVCALFSFVNFIRWCLVFIYHFFTVAENWLNKRVYYTVKPL